MRWPWSRNTSKDCLVVSWTGDAFAWVQAKSRGNGVYQIYKHGVQYRGTDRREQFLDRIKALHLQAPRVYGVLRPEQYQLLQIDAPPVAPEEMRAAARYQIRDMVESHIDDITIDVMRVGDTGAKDAKHVFVVAANNALLREFDDLAQTMRWPLSVLDIAENAQRNLQLMIAARDGTGQAATAALMVVGERQAILTISANKELFYSRRLELPEGFFDMDWGTETTPPAPVQESYTPVQEYVPDYSGLDAWGGGLAGGAALPSAADRAQRFVVEVQRSLDLWDRTWSTLPLAGLRLYAGAHSAQLATWLGKEIGQSVGVLDFAGLFPAQAELSGPDQMACLPLFGALLRSDVNAL